MTDSLTTKIFIRDLCVEMLIGIHAHEQARPQRVFVTVEAFVDPQDDWRQDKITEVVSYSDIVSAIKRIAMEGHINLLETFAERIASECLREKRIRRVTVRVEKPDIYADAAAAGVEIVRIRRPPD